MNHQMREFNKILGIFLIILGCVSLCVALAPLIVPAFFFLLGLYLINYGMKLRGTISLSAFTRSWWLHFKNFR